MNQKGVTLIEMIIVTVILAIGAALMVPSIGGWLPYYHLRSATKEVSSAMRLAQIKAVSNHSNYRVTFDTANKTYLIEYQDTGGLWVSEGEAQSLQSKVQVNTTFAGNIATFFPNSTANTGDVVLQNTKGSTKTVRLLGTTGRIKIE